LVYRKDEGRTIGNLHILIISLALWVFGIGIVIFWLRYNKVVVEKNMLEKDREKKNALIKKEAMIQAKEALQAEKDKFNDEVRDKKQELNNLETRLFKREDELENKLRNAENKEQEVIKKQDELIEKEDYLAELITKQLDELEKISGLSRDDAKNMLLEQIRNDLQQEYMQLVRENEEKIKENAQEQAQEILSTTMQRCVMDQVVASTVSVVSLPSDEIKGRIIGREGRNIRTLETLTGVDFIIDDTPEAVVLSCFDPIKREIAKVALEKLIADGRIHPVRIEDVVEKAKEEIEQKIKREGENAALEMGIMNLNKELVKNLGRLYYRTSYGQNVLKHSLEVGHLANVSG